MKRMLLLIVAVLATIAFTTSAASAEGNAKWCLDGATTSLPVTMTVPQGSRDLTEGVAQAVINSGGTFYFGYHAGIGRLLFMIGGSDQDAEEAFEEGWTGPHTISAGACAGTFKPMPARVAICSSQPMERGDGTMGVYQDIPIAQWLDEESPYYGFSAAKFAKGGPVNGTTCDNLPGYKATGQLVDASGLQQGGNGQVYPEYVYNG